MKLRSIIIFLSALALAGCITIEDVPIITVNPTATISTYVSGGELNATISLNHGTTVIVAGNVDLEYVYTGTASMINAANSEVIATATIDLEGPNPIVFLAADTAGIDEILIVVSGELDVWAKDKDDTYLTSSPYYGEEQIVYYAEEIPILSIAPSVELSWNISGGNLNATVMLYANPAIQVLGTVPIIYEYQGSTFLTDMETGKILEQVTYSDNLTSQFVMVSADTTGIDRMLITALGNINVYADVGSDGNPDNDIFLNSGQFYDEMEVIINPE